MEIRNDAAKVANYERMFAAEATEREARQELATVVEAIFFDQVGRTVAGAGYAGSAFQ